VSETDNFWFLIISTVKIIGYCHFHKQFSESDLLVHLDFLSNSILESEVLSDISHIVTYCHLHLSVEIDSRCGWYCHLLSFTSECRNLLKVCVILSITVICIWVENLTQIASDIIVCCQFTVNLSPNLHFNTHQLYTYLKHFLEIQCTYIYIYWC
jgi:hypothetical protein